MRVRTSVAGTIGCLILFLGSSGALNRADASVAGGACCLPHGSCLDSYDATSCPNIGGAFLGEGTDCSSTMCPAAVPCGESGSPVCGGTCPAGTRCIDTSDLQVIILVSLLFAQDELVTPQDCRCVEVSCGGVPLANGQGCCAGTPFTIGLQGCCNGEIVPVDSACNCSGGFTNGNGTESALLPIDLRDSGCCALDFPLGATGSSTEEGIISPAFNVVQAGCCQRQLFGDDQQNPFVGASLSTYTFGTGLDCCPGGPLAAPQDITSDLAQALELAGLCVGGCSRGECASQDCCRCSGCESDFGEACVSAGSPSSCESLCRTVACEGAAYVENAICTEDGSCTASAAAAPAASPAGLVALLIALIAIGGFTMLGRRRRAS